MDGKLHLPHGATAEGAFSLRVTPEQAGWAFSGLRVLELAPGASQVLQSGAEELLVLPLAGSCVVECESRRFELTGRDDVFARVTDFAYLPIDAEVRISSSGGGRFALPSALAGRRLDPAYGAAEDVAVELRGAGQTSRQVNNFCAPEAFEADRLIAVEVLTPGGNWSSYPPHKHDEQRHDEAILGRSTTSRSPATTGSATSGSTAPGRTGGSTCAPRCAPATWCWSPTATTGRRWPRPATTCTT